MRQMRMFGAAEEPIAARTGYVSLRIG
jgi:hypothetical protein